MQGLSVNQEITTSSNNTANYSQARVLKVLPLKFDYVRNLETGEPLKRFKKDGNFLGYKIYFSFLELDENDNGREWEGKAITQRIEVDLNENAASCKRFIHLFNGVYQSLTGKQAFKVSNIEVDNSQESKLFDFCKSVENMEVSQLETNLEIINGVITNAKTQLNVDFKKGNLFCHYNWNGKYLTPYSNGGTCITKPEKQWSTGLVFPFSLEDVEIKIVKGEDEETGEEITSYLLNIGKETWNLKDVKFNKGEVKKVEVDEEM